MGFGQRYHGVVLLLVSWTTPTRKQAPTLASGQGVPTISCMIALSRLSHACGLHVAPSQDMTRLTVDSCIGSQATPTPSACPTCSVLCNSEHLTSLVCIIDFVWNRSCVRSYIQPPSSCCFFLASPSNRSVDATQWGWLGMRT